MSEELIINQTRGWKLGLKNLLWRENKKWWGTSRWWIQTLVWGVITNGVLALLLFLIPFISATFEGVNPEELADLPNGIGIFFSLAGIAMPIGVVILVQGSIITEKELGTAEWVLSKPASRTAFVVSKLLASSFGVLVTYVIIQASAAYGLIMLSQSAPLRIMDFIKGAVLLMLLLFFYIALTLMLEVLFDRRGVVLGISLGTALGGALLVNLFPGLGMITPFSIPSLIPMIVDGTIPMNTPVWLPFISTGVLSIIFVIVTIRQFNSKGL